jgi:hypothetical protein
MALVAGLQPGSELATFRIESVEREDVLLAHDSEQDRVVALHVAADPPGELSTIRFLERVRRLQNVEHPHLLDVYGARTLEGRCVAIAEAPPGERLDRLRPNAGDAIEIVRQVATAVEALEQAGAESPPLVAERIWVAGDGARLDGLDAHARIRTASSAAALAYLLDQLVPHIRGPLTQVLARARDGAYLSAGQFARELHAAERQPKRFMKFLRS